MQTVANIFRFKHSHTLVVSGLGGQKVLPQLPLLTCGCRCVSYSHTGRSAEYSHDSVDFNWVSHELLATAALSVCVCVCVLNCLLVVLTSELLFEALTRTRR